MAKAGRRAAASAADLFCGAGGLAYGSSKAGLRVAAGTDAGETCRHAFEANARARLACKSVEDVAPAGLSGLCRGRGRRILIGCAPCQPFSSYSRSRTDGTRWTPLSAFARLVRGTAPDAVSMENVPRLRPHAVLEKLVGRLRRGGCRAWHDAASCPDCGVPQARRRPVLPASKPGGIRTIGGTHAGGPPAVRGATGGPGPIRAGGSSPRDPPRRARGLSAANPGRIPQAPEGGGRGDRGGRLVLPRHRRRPGRSCDSVYGRMPWNRPAPTATTQAIAPGSGRFGRPGRDRALPLGEAAPIQTFPRGCKPAAGKAPVRIDTVARHVGNAAPAALGRAIALSIKRHLADHDGGV